MLSYILPASFAAALPIASAPSASECIPRTMDGHSVVDVACEPKHVERWRNENVRVFEVNVQANQNALWHYHDRKTVLHIIRPSTLSAQGLGKEAAVVSLKKGIEFPVLPSIHRWTSLDSFYSVGVEILSKATTAAVVPDIKLIRDDPSYRAYEHYGNKTVTANIANSAVVLMSDGCFELNSVSKCGKAGDDFWITSGQFKVASTLMSLIQVL